jgi:hypothetical protein
VHRTSSFTIDTSRIDTVLDQHLFAAVEEQAAREQVKAYAIGGYVRDLILGRPCKDIDFVVEGDGIAFAEKVAERLGAGQVHVFKNFGTAMFRFSDMDVEFVGRAARATAATAASRMWSPAPSRRPGAAGLHDQRAGHLAERGRSRRADRSL